MRQPLRVVFDREARLPLDSQLMRTLDQAPVVVVVSPEADSADLASLRDAGAEPIVAGDVPASLAALGARGVTSLFLEGGSILAAAFADADQIDEARTFVAPTLLGGSVARAGGAVGGPIPEEALATAGDGGSPAATGPARRNALSSSVETVGEDVLITARFKEW